MLLTLLSLINSGVILVSLAGLYSQLNRIWHSKHQQGTDGASTGATHVLSLNQFTVSFFAYFSFFVYGYLVTPVNHLMIWPRLAAALLISFILLEIWRDRRSATSKMCLCLVLLSFVIFGVLVSGSSGFEDSSKNIISAMIVIFTIFLAQGYLHQIRLIIKAGETGAVDIRMNQFILMMDISTIAMALAMGLSESWPLLLLATVSAITKLVILYLFYWVRVSPVAQLRRLQQPN